MPRKSPYTIKLDEEEKHQLQSIARKYTSPYYEVMRAKAILLAAEGLENKQIGQQLQMPRQVISKWRKRFFEQRLSGLQDRPRRGRPSRFSPQRSNGGQSFGLPTAQ
ncbi:MAG: helix-turn-helix domain-containing protein [Deltaproteobacteria bacterium]|nr:helix-turn-helix domain-containing protein [Deltaproteobacteria bacterium]